MFVQIIFGFRAEKIEQLNEKYTQDCQNYVQSVQRNNFRMFLWNDETLLKLFVRWSKLMNFWQKGSLRVQRNVRSFFGGESNCSSVVGSERKYPAFAKKFMEGLLKVRVLSKTLRKNDKIISFYYHPFWDSDWVFPDFVKQSSQVCRNSNLSVQRKDIKKKWSWTIASSSFLDFEKKNLCFYRKVSSKLVKNTFYVSRGTLTEQHFWKED